MLIDSDATGVDVLTSVVEEEVAKLAEVQVKNKHQRSMALPGELVSITSTSHERVLSIIVESALRNR